MRLLNFRMWAYSANTFSASEQPTTTKWNYLWSNDASFNDGTGLGDGTIKDIKLAVNPETFRKEVLGDFVVSGCVWGTSANLLANMSLGICYINGRRFSVSAVTSHSFTASKDTYVDVRDNLDGTYALVYTEQTNLGAELSLASNSMRLAIVRTSGSAVTTVITGRVVLGVNNPSGAYLMSPATPMKSTRVIGKVELPANIAWAGSTERDLSGDGVTITVNVPANVERIRIVFQSGMQSTVAGSAGSIMSFYEGATLLRQCYFSVVASALNTFMYFTHTVENPTSGSHTYKMKISATTGTNTLIGGAQYSQAFWVEIA